MKDSPKQINRAERQLQIKLIVPLPPDSRTSPIVSWDGIKLGIIIKLANEWDWIEILND